MINPAPKHPIVMRIEDFFWNGDAFSFPVATFRTNVLANNPSKPLGSSTSFYNPGQQMPVVPQNPMEKGVLFSIEGNFFFFLRSVSQVHRRSGSKWLGLDEYKKLKKHTHSDKFA
jgi:hypothetical protein